MNRSVKKPSFSFSPLTIGYAIFRDFPARIFPYSDSIRINLRKAGIRISYVSYISSMFFWTIIVFIISYVVSSFFSRFPMLSFLMNLLMSILGASVCFIMFLYYPRYIAGSRGREIDKNLVYISNYMSIMANAGATVEQIFQSLAKYGDIYGVKYLARDVVRNVELLGQDVVESLDVTAKFSPTPEFAKLLQGFIATMKTGGSLSSYLSTMGNEYIEYRRRFLARLIEQLNLTGEIYIAALVALPIIFITMFSIMGFIGGGVMGGLSSEQLMPLLIYVFIPFMAIGIIVYIDAVLASW